MKNVKNFENKLHIPEHVHERC